MWSSEPSVNAEIFANIRFSRNKEKKTPRKERKTKFYLEPLDTALYGSDLCLCACVSSVASYLHRHVSVKVEVFAARIV
jgi:hypothetical protein